MPTIDVLFPVLGTTLPTDHLYPLYSALTRGAPVFHQDDARLSFAPISGDRASKGLIRVHDRSHLRIRLAAETIATVLPLAGNALDVAGHPIRLGVPRVVPLIAAPALAARVVTIKHSTEPERFLSVARQKLDALGVKGEVRIPLIESGDRQGEPRRRVVRVKGTRIIGFALLVAGLTAEESITLQENGLGGRTRMGCGFFLPSRRPEGEG